MTLQITSVEDSQGNTIPDRGQTRDVTLKCFVETNFPNQAYLLRVSKRVLGQGTSDSNRVGSITVDVSHLEKAQHSFNVALSDSDVSKSYVIELLS
ncbi:hypothetical protein JBE38_16205 [Pseudomonas sp. ICBG1301]|uniref:hypothetical protein n=1 Tax=Pseudomonas sp. ICBG1301 TaxID=2795987 RepID=UPI000F887045|nr:hypothetical protein [Pseudomonas sp. ICBG1301]MBM9487476.1 hypothetical protein [Pseudomonas sp. ICBG1301]RUQ46941.1 hypothetical protein D8M30_10845 [Corynebacterium pseudodiphtheriticum]